MLNIARDNPQTEYVKNERTGNFTDKPKKVAKKTLKYWKSVFNQETQENHYIPAYKKAFPINVPKMNEFKPFTITELEEYLKNKKDDSAPGPDQVTYHLLKQMDQENLQMILQKTNQIAEGETVPEEWKEAYHWPVYKKGKKSKFQNYRPITLASVLRKILTGMIANRITHHIETNDIYIHSQDGFRRERSTQGQVTALKSLIRNANLNDKELHIIYIDIKGAFDAVPHKGMFETLTNYGIDGKTIRILKDLYNGNKTRIITSHGLTEAYAANRGTHQGDPLSPTIFGLFLNPILKYIQENTEGYKVGNAKVTHLAFADDVALTAESQEELKKAFDLFLSFCYYNNMALNTDKTAYTSNKQQQSLPKEFHVVANKTNKSTPIKLLQSNEPYEYLGTLIQANGEEEAEKKDKIKKTNQIIDLILTRKVSPFLLASAINSLAYPVIQYSMATTLYTEEEINEITKKIKNKIRKNVNSFALPTEKMHTAWKEGGFQLQVLEERQAQTQISLLVDRILNGPSTASKSILQELFKPTEEWKAHPLTLTQTPEPQHFTPAIQNALKLLKKEKISIIDTTQELASINNLLPDSMEETKKTYTKTLITSQSLPPLIQMLAETVKSVIPYTSRPKLSPPEGSPKTTYAWTDGSQKYDEEREKNVTSAAVFFGNKNLSNIKFKPIGPQTNNSAEIQAIEMALLALPPTQKIEITTDSQIAKTDIEKIYQGIAPSTKNENFAALNRIQGILKERREKGGVLKINHIYSHTKEKKTKGSRTKKAKWKNKINKQKAEMGKTYKIHKKGNQKVDKIASGTKPRTKFTGKGPPAGSKNYLLFKKENTKEVKRGEWIHTTAKEWYKKTKERKRSRTALKNEAARLPRPTGINWKYSNLVFSSPKVPSSAKTFLIRARTDQIHNNFKTYKKDPGKQTCPYCPNKKETTTHHLGKCISAKLHKERIRYEIKRMYGQHNIPPHFAKQWLDEGIQKNWVWALEYVPNEIAETIKNQRLGKKKSEGLIRRIVKMIACATHKRYTARHKHSPPPKKTHTKRKKRNPTNKRK